jgi:hypothetical protein
MLINVSYLLRKKKSNSITLLLEEEIDLHSIKFAK